MPNPDVSILIPSYNHAAYIRACIESIQNQSLSSWELIVVDDGSQDSSFEIVQDLASRDSRIQLVRNETNLGTYGTEQKALDLAQARYVAIMNSDDIWAPTKLERQVASLESDSNASFCYVLGAMVDEKGTVLEADVHGDWSRSDPQEPLPSLLSENRILASGVLFRSKTLRFETTCRYSGDWVALLEQSRQGAARCIPEPLTYWRQHATNSYRRSLAQTFEELRIRRAIHDHRARWAVREIPRSEIAAGLAMNAMHIVPLLVLVNQMQLARSFAWYALANSPNKVKAIKRLLGLHLGADRSRRHFWTAEDIAIVAGEEAHIQEKFANQPPLVFRN